jgi:alkanesulfonate monooxygenase SsuD/methylene tetrahydromethanopterin reductase-like flavin-dependent oxidoreductase (luciferase family)
LVRPLKIGVQLPEVEYVASWSEVREMARTAKGIGLDSVWLGDHLLDQWDGQPSRGPWEAWTSLAAIAAVTERIELGPLVAATSFAFAAEGVAHVQLVLDPITANSIGRLAPALALLDA